MTKNLYDSSYVMKEKISKLKTIIPECFSEGKLDCELIKQNFNNDYINDENNRYSFTWAGMQDSISNMYTSSKGTLIPDKKQSIKFDETNNIYIEGENLEVLKLLQKSYSNKIKMIYIDPPYNTGKDRIYKDDYKKEIGKYLEQTNQKKNGIKLTTNQETSGRFHSDWISFMYPRLFLARYLLKDDGVIFVSISDDEFHNLRIIMNRIFGEENFITTIVWQKKYSPQSDAKYFSDMHDYILVYAKIKNNNNIKHGWCRNLLPRTKEMNKRYKNLDNDPRGPWKSGGLSAKTYNKNYDYPILTPSGKKVYPPKNGCWQITKDRFNELVKDKRIYFGKNGDSVPSLKQFLSEVQDGKVPSTWWTREFAGDNQEATQELKKQLSNHSFSTPKPVKLIKKIIQLSTSENDIILDFFAGSGTTGEAVWKQNLEDKKKRTFILIQISEEIIADKKTPKSNYKTISELAIFRLKKVINELKNNKHNSKIGLKIFKSSDSNFKQWSYDDEDIDKLKKTIKKFECRLINNYEDINVIYEHIIKFGFDLNANIKQTKLDSIPVYKISDNNKQTLFYISLNKSIRNVENIKLNKNDLFICLDSSLNDGQKITLSKKCKLETI